MHKSNLTDGSTIKVDMENFPTGIIEIEIELKFNNWNITIIHHVQIKKMPLVFSQ